MKHKINIYGMYLTILILPYQDMAENYCVIILYFTSVFH